MRWVWVLLAAGCGGAGEWQVSVYGEPFIEEGMPPEVFADGCEATFSTFEVAVTETALLDGDGQVVGSGDARVIDLVQPGPHDLAVVTAPGGLYDTVRFRVAPTSDQPDSVFVEGTLTCAAETVSFSWRFATDTTYLCAPDGLTLPAGGVDSTQFTVHGDHLFYDGLANEDAEVRGQVLVDADLDGDGEVTQDELSNVDVAPLGYQVGPFSEVTDMNAFLANLTGSMGHIDGEGHCDVQRN